MQPNNDINTTSTSVAPSANETPVVPTMPNQPNAEKKGGKGMLIGLILCLLLAVGGVGFGVWEMMDANSQKDSYDKQISALKTQNGELLEKMSESIEKNDITDVETNASYINTAEYIYLGEWGYKIRISGDLKKVSYALRQNTNGYTNLIISGLVGDDGRLPGFANMAENTYGMLTVARFPKGTEMPLASPPTLIFSDDKYDYYYYHPQALYSTGDEEKGQESESMNSIMDMVKTTNNWSAI